MMTLNLHTRSQLLLHQLVLIKLSPYMQGSFNLQKKSQSLGQRELKTHKELQPEKQGKSICCHFHRMAQSTSQ